MPRRLAAGLIGGAVGTLALDAVSYGDMLLQGRSPSDLPGQAAARLAKSAGIDLGADQSEQGANRRSALGALLGYATGVAIGCVYSLARDRFDGRWPVAGLEVGLVAMLSANGPMVAQGLTDPRTWGIGGWISDIVPHVAYGLATAAVVETLVT